MSETYDVFLVEDDEAVNTLVTRLLQRSSIKVASFRDVDSFLKAVLERGDTAELLILDYSIAGRPASELLDVLQKQKLERFMFSFLVSTICLCLLTATLGLCYASSSLIIGIVSSILHLVITIIKRSKVSKVPQRGIFDIGKVHEYFNHHHST